MIPVGLCNLCFLQRFIVFLCIIHTEHGHTIQLQNIGLAMDGTTLTCKAENSAGSAEASAVAYVKSMGSNSHGWLIIILTLIYCI